MADIFQKQVKILEYECDMNQRMTLSNLMRHSQQMGSDHLAQKNIGYNTLREAGMVFVVTKMQMQIIRRPTFGETLLLTTIPRQPKGVQFIRDTWFETPEGERIVSVSISWALVDPQSHRILRPSSFDVYGFQMSPNDGETIIGYKIKPPMSPRTMHLRQVKYTDLDYNRHVNNAVYADMICDSVPLGALLYREISRFGIQFHREATVGQVLDIGVAEITDGYYLCGEIGTQKSFEAELVFHAPVDQVQAKQE